MSKAQLETKLNNKLINTFSKHYVEFNQPLDKYFYNYDIKEFLQKFCGCNSFEEIPNELRKAVFSNYAKTVMPDWNTPERE